MATSKQPPLCVDCTTLGLRSRATARSSRCQTHQIEYRRWYRRNWKLQKNNPGLSSIEASYQPVAGVVGAFVTPEAVAQIQEAAESIGEAVVTLMADRETLRANPRWKATVQVARELSVVSLDLQRLAEMMRRTLPPEPQDTSPALSPQPTVRAHWT